MQQHLGAIVGWLQEFSGTPLARGIGSAVLVYVVYRLALAAWQRQKDAEHTRARMVDDGIERVAAGIDHMLAVHRHNWQMLLRYIKLYRDAEATVRVDAFLGSLIGLDSADFQIVPAKRVADLLREPLIWIGYQKVHLFVTTRNDTIAAEFGSALNAALARPAQADKPAIIAESERLAASMNTEAKQLYEFLAQMAGLATLADRHIHDRSSAAAFGRRKDVRQIVERLKQDFPVWAEEAANEAA